MYPQLLWKSSLSALAAFAGVAAFAADVTVPRVINANATWTADNTYFLNGFTFVITPSGAAAPTVLTIEPGTVIKARQKGAGTNNEASALVVARGAQINAAGTATEPIVFTSELDNLSGNLGPDDRELWGGVVILGSATINSRADESIVTAPIVDQIEGFALTGTEADYIQFGGTNDDDNSGVFRYVSIRHGGNELATSNEINGLSLGGVGRGTAIDHIEVFANKDDGIEFFGGTVDLKYAVAAFGRDDGFDYDQGWRGRGQFWFVIGPTDATEATDKGGEWDGSTAPVDATPIGGTTVFNATFIGNGASSAANTALNIRDNAIAKVYNSVFTEFANMLNLEADNQTRLDAGDVDFASNIWWSHVAANNNAAAFDVGAINTETFWTDTAKNNTIADPLLKGVSRTDDGVLDPRPASNSPALTGPFATVPSGGWYVQTAYKGAFAPGAATWLQGWTKLSTDGYLANLPLGANQDFINISTRCNVGTGDNVAIAGFIISGPDAKRVLLRLVGKPLEAAPISLGGVLQDPFISLYAGSSIIESNDNWQDNANAAEITAVTTALGIGLNQLHDNDAVLLVTLEPGSYTLIGSGAGGTSGLAIIEAYAAD